MSKLIRLTGLWQRRDGSLSGGPLRDVMPGARLIIQPVTDRQGKGPHYVAYLAPEGEDEPLEQLRLLLEEDEQEQQHPF